MNTVMRWLHRSEVKRVDRERMYIWVHAGLPFVGFAIAWRPSIMGLPLLSTEANRVLGLLIVLGSGLCLIGSCMGAGKFLPETRIDTRIPYLSGAFGQLSVMASLSSYIFIIAKVSPDIHIMGLGVTIAIAAACLHITAVALKEVWRITHFVSHPECKWWVRKP